MIVSLSEKYGFLDVVHSAEDNFEKITFMLHFGAPKVGIQFGLMGLLLKVKNIFNLGDRLI